MEGTSRVLSLARITKVLMTLSLSGALGRRDREKVTVLLDLFQLKPKVRLPRILSAIWAEKNISDALNYFRQFKVRLNKRLSNLEILCRMVHPTAPTPAEGKQVWFELTVTDAENSRETVVSRGLYTKQCGGKLKEW